ncbi:hypothetical protein F8M41_023295 [Gigaspora margarita]|uniref:Uncharacterized protein n=1 Tax=Gigaspora margarita TaxID=4874 RepID=A0A8H4B0X2_GIGMA|nr:hypothetical protein F8M41_023295 [Gigaspora margarita]
MIRDIFYSDKIVILAACRMVKDINDDVYVIKFFRALRKDFLPEDFRDRFNGIIKNYFDEKAKSENKKHELDEKEEENKLKKPKYENLQKMKPIILGQKPIPNK